MWSINYCFVQIDENNVLFNTVSALVCSFFYISTTIFSHCVTHIIILSSKYKINKAFNDNKLHENRSTIMLLRLNGRLYVFFPGKTYNITKDHNANFINRHSWAIFYLYANEISMKNLFFFQWYNTVILWYKSGLFITL